MSDTVPVTGPVYVVREARPVDAPVIASHHIDSFSSTYTHYPKTSAAAARRGRAWERHWAHRLGDETGRVLVAADDDYVVGFVDIYVNQMEDGVGVGEIRSIHVAPSRSGSGVGTLLMAAGEDLMRDLGFREAFLWVVSDNHRARSFYERLGWSLDGGRRREILAVGDEEGDDVEVIRYRKRLGGAGGSQ